LTSSEASIVPAITETKQLQTYLHAYASVSEARASIASYFEFYNSTRPHSRLKALTPDQVYFNRLLEILGSLKQKQEPPQEITKTVRTIECLLPT
jgi:hypothetical protein